MMINEQNRLHYWAALTVFSIVSLSSMTNSFDEDQDWVREEKWAVTVASVSLILAVFAFFLRMFMTKMFTENYMEHIMVFVVLVFWCVGLPYVNDRENFLSVSESGVILNINLFFSSWLAFITTMKLFADTFPAKFMGDRVSTFTGHWIGFGTATLVVTANAVMYWRDNCESTDTSNMCHRDLFAFVLGAISGLFAIVFMAFHHDRLEQLSSIVLAAAWCFGIAYLTFDDGPGTYVGTFYFSVWFSFLFTFWVAVHSVVAVFTEMSGSEDTTPDEVPAAGGEGEKGAQEATAKQDAEEHEKEEVA